MKISYNWLKEYIDLDQSPEEVSKVLTDIGLEVEGLEEVQSVKGGLEGVVVGEVMEVTDHPNADKLRLTKVDIGEVEQLPIVCGAPNVATGQKVLVAKVGSTIYPKGEEKGLKIKKAKIRGEASQGMICAEDELGLGNDHDGIMVLDEEAPVGMEAAQFLDVRSDHVFEIGLTPNRADAMSHLGVARDLKAYYNYHGGSVKLKEIPHASINRTDNNKVAIEVEDAEGCPKYVGLFIDNVKVVESPDWLKRRLQSIGLSPINNVVDITNFVLHETGQPLHAFDGSVAGDKVIVRRAKAGEKFVTLDDEARELHQEDLMICNASDPMCIAGVYGGAGSGVTENTTSVFLESAWFDPVSIRRSSKRHGLHTDASFRFEREVDPNITEFALQRAAKFIVEICDGVPDNGFTLVGQGSFPPFEVAFNPDRARSVIGDSIGDAAFNRVFHELEMDIDAAQEWLVKVPRYRVDVKREADLIEDFLRIHGYNNGPIPVKVNATMASGDSLEPQKLREKVSAHLSSRGFSETLNNSLTTLDYTNLINEENIVEKTAVKMLNPLSNELDVMRQTMLFGLLESIEHNQNRQHPDLKLYEFGKTYLKQDEGYVETDVLALAISGNKHDESWTGKSEPVNFYTLKSYVEGIIEVLGLKVRTGELNDPCLDDGISYKVGKNIAAELGWVRDNILDRFDIKNPVYYASFNWGDVLKFYSSKVTYNEIPKFPMVRRDLSMLLDESVKFNEIVSIARSSEKKLLKEVNLFDVYEGDNLEKGKKSYAVSFMLQDESDTLTDMRVDKVMDKIYQNLSKQLGATLR